MLDYLLKVLKIDRVPTSAVEYIIFYINQLYYKLYIQVDFSCVILHENGKLML